MKNNLPKAYQRGWIEFFKLKFAVNQDVLIPRPETELLVEEVLNSLKHQLLSIKEDQITVLDIGTGSGNIAISVAKNTPNIRIIASDISAQALQVARKNAKFHGVDDKIKFIKSDLLGNPLILNTKYKILIIVANLPYIPSSRIETLDPSVKDFEPHKALDGGKNGFTIYQKLFEQITDQGLKPQNIICEIDDTEEDLALKQAQKYFPRAQVKILPDLAKIPRILLISSSL